MEPTKTMSIEEANLVFQPSGGTSSFIDFATTTTSLSGRRVVYNLRGQQVANPTHGLYIVDGKKVFIQ